MSLKASAGSGVKWSGVSHIGRRLLSLFTNIVLARLLAPEDFGLVAMAAVVLGFIDLFRDLGTGTAIIQRQSISEDLLSSVFWLNAGFGVAATLVLILGAPLVGFLYQEPRVIPLLQVLALSFFLSALGIVQSSLLTRELAFERLAKVEVGSAFVASATGIGCALAGLGVWSLVFQVLAGNALTTASLWFVSRWRPRFAFHWGELRSVMGYSLNLTGANIFNYFTRNADNMLIGRFLGAENLGYYNLAYQLMLYPLQGISAVVGRVMFPLYSKMQDDAEQFRRVYLMVAAAIALITFPVMLGLLAVREPLVLAMFGLKWEPVIGLLALFAPLGAIQSIATTVGAIYQAKGRTDIMLRWTLGAGTAVIVAFVVGLQWGIMGVAACYTAVSVLLLYPGFAIPFRLIHLPVMALARILARPLACALLMYGTVALLGWQLLPGLDNPRQLAVLVPVGALCYGALIWLIDRENVLRVIATLRAKP